MGKDSTLLALFVHLRHRHHLLAESQIIQIDEIIFLPHRCWAFSLLWPIDQKLDLFLGLLLFIVLIDLELDNPGTPLARRREPGPSKDILSTFRHHWASVEKHR